MTDGRQNRFRLEAAVVGALVFATTKTQRTDRVGARSLLLQAAPQLEDGRLEYLTTVAASVLAEEATADLTAVVLLALAAPDGQVEYWTERAAELEDALGIDKSTTERCLARAMSIADELLGKRPAGRVQ